MAHDGRATIFRVDEFVEEDVDEPSKWVKRKIANVFGEHE